MARSKESIGILVGLLFAATAAWAGPEPSYAPPVRPALTGGPRAPGARRSREAVAAHGHVSAPAPAVKLPASASYAAALAKVGRASREAGAAAMPGTMPVNEKVDAVPAKTPRPAEHLHPVRKVEKRRETQAAPRRVIHVSLPKNAYRVSTSDYNVFAFPEPLRRAVLPPGAPLAGKPLYMSHNQVLLLRFYPDDYRPVQMVAELQSGAVVTLSLVPDPEVAGVRIHVQVQGVEPQPRRQLKHAADPNSRFVTVLARVVAGRKLSGYTPAPLPPERIYDRLVARPVASNAAGGTVITQYALTARRGKRSVVDPGQFSWPGVRAALLTGNIVDAHDSPFLYVVTRHETRE